MGERVVGKVERGRCLRQITARHPGLHAKEVKIQLRTQLVSYRREAYKELKLGMELGVCTNLGRL